MEIFDLFRLTNGEQAGWPMLLLAILIAISLLIAERYYGRRK